MPAGPIPAAARGPAVTGMETAAPETQLVHFSNSVSVLHSDKELEKYFKKLTRERERAEEMAQRLFQRS